MKAVSFRWHSADLSGDAVVFDGSNADEIRAFVPDRYGEKDGQVTITDDDGREIPLGSGWAVSRDDDGEVTIHGARARNRWMREVP